MRLDIEKLQHGGSKVTIRAPVSWNTLGATYFRIYFESAMGACLYNCEKDAVWSCVYIQSSTAQDWAPLGKPPYQRVHWHKPLSILVNRLNRPNSVTMGHQVSLVEPSATSVETTYIFSKHFVHVTHTSHKISWCGCISRILPLRHVLRQR